MIFSRTLELVLSGRKTETRRKHKVANWTLGNTYAAQPGRGKKAAAKLKATGHRTERLGDITEASARAEGSESVAAFKEAWQGLHKSFDPELVVHVYSFEVVR